MAAPGAAAFNGIDLLNARDLFVFDLPDARARDHAGMAVDPSGAVTSGECVFGGDSGDDNIRVGVFLVL